MPQASDVCVEQAVQVLDVPQQRSAQDGDSTEPLSTPLLRPTFGITMAQYFQQLRPMLETSQFATVSSMDEDGLYLHKRHIRGDHGKMLEQAGTVLLHTLIYLKSGDKVIAYDFGPVGDADVTSNLTESVPCGPVVHDPADVAKESSDMPFLHIKVPHHPATAEALSQAVKFCESLPYHAFTNNCIQNTDFLVRVLTGGRVRNAPLAYDALCGSVPEQDNPMLLMFMLMTGISWFDVCDGSRLAAAYTEQHGKPPLPKSH